MAIILTVVFAVACCFTERDSGSVGYAALIGTETGLLLDMFILLIKIFAKGV